MLLDPPLHIVVRLLPIHRVVLEGDDGKRIAAVAMAVRTVSIRGIRGYATLDVHLEGDRLYVLEVNPNPALRATSSMTIVASSERLSGSSLNALLRVVVARDDT